MQNHLQSLERKSAENDCRYSEVECKQLVPQIIAEACKCKLSGPASTFVLASALQVLRKFLHWAENNGLLSREQQGSTAQQSRASLQAVVLQQLQDSGIQVQLIRVMTEVAQRLSQAQTSGSSASAATAAAAAGSRCPAQPATTGSSDGIDLLMLYDVSVPLLVVRTMLPVVGPVLVHGVDFALAVLRHLDWALQQQQQQQRRLPDDVQYGGHYQALLGVALYHLRHKVPQYPQLQPLALWQALPGATAACGCIAVTVMFTDCLEALQLPGPNSSNGSDGGGRSGSGSSKGGLRQQQQQARPGGSRKKKGRSRTAAPAAAAAGAAGAAAAAAGASAAADNGTHDWAWGVAVAHQEHMPSIPSALLEQMGLSRVLLTYAAALMLHSGMPDLVVVDMRQVLFEWEEITEHALPLDPKQRGEAHQQQREHGLGLNESLSMAQLELSTLLLQWVADNVPASDLSLFLDCSCRALLAVSAVRRDFTTKYARQLRKKHVEAVSTDADAQQQQQQQHGPVCPCCGLAEADAQSDERLVDMLSNWLAGLLPPLLKHASVLISSAKAAAIAAGVPGAVAAQALGAGNTSGSSSGSSNSQRVMKWVIKPHKVLVALLGDLSSIVYLFSGAARATTLRSETEGYICADAWGEHGEGVLAFFEGYARLLATLGDYTAADSPDKKPVARQLFCSTGHHLWSLFEVTEHQPRVGVLLLQAQWRVETDSAYASGFKGLIGSLLKLAVSSGVRDTQDALQCCTVATAAAGMVMADVAGAEPDDSAADEADVDAGTASSSSSSGGSTGCSGSDVGSSSSSESEQGSEYSIDVDCVSCLSWLVLVGRCFYQTANVMGCVDLVGGPGRQAANTLQRLDIVNQQVRATLRVLGGSEQLLSAGYSLQALQEQMVGVAAAERAVFEAFRDMSEMEPTDAALDAVRGAMTAYAQQLRLFGLAASTVPVPDYCNNPGCVNVGGASEAVLVLGKGCMCGGCRVGHYCSRVCQRQHWKLHKPACQALAAAKAATARAAAATATEC